VPFIEGFKIVFKDRRMGLFRKAKYLTECTKNTLNNELSILMFLLSESLWLFDFVAIKIPAATSPRLKFGSRRIIWIGKSLWHYRTLNIRHRRLNILCLRSNILCLHFSPLSGNNQTLSDDNQRTLFPN
jgi:hypothetical protein